MGLQQTSIFKLGMNNFSWLDRRDLISGEQKLALAVLVQAKDDYHDPRYHDDVEQFLEGGVKSILELWCQVAGVDQDWFVGMVREE